MKFGGRSVKHYVKIMSGGKTVADALIEAESPSAAVKEALRGEGIDLSRIEPDNAYTVSSGDVMSSSFGDEFDRTADFSGDDKPNMDGHLHGFDGRKTGIYPGVDALRDIFGGGDGFIRDMVFPKECAHDFDDGNPLPGGVINRAGCAHEYDPTPDPTLDRCRHCGDFRPVPFDPAEEKRMRALDRARRMGAAWARGAGIQPPDAKRKPIFDLKRLAKSLGIETDLMFDFECDCGTVTHHETELEGGPVDYRHSCPGCGANHVTRIER